ncbi:MAG: DUF2975 domain-containing protein [Solirubrobacterales bacterium]|nr:DUF2975 domain-containing protein [Solirubrobacterales bacterium]
MMRSGNLDRSATVAVEVIWWASLTAVLVVSGLLILVATHAAGGGALTLDSFFELRSAAYRISAPGLSHSAATLGLSAGSLSFARPRPGFVLVGTVVLAVAAGAWLYIVYQLRGLLAALRAGATFASENELRVRRIGVAVIAFELGHALAVWGVGVYLEHALVAHGVALRSHFAVNVTVILLGLLLLALAAAFRVGSELAEDQALTV